MTPVGRRVVLAVGATAVCGLLAFVVAAPPERCPAITAGDVRSAADATVRWMTTNQHPDGSWLYEYDRARDEAADDYNVIRHAGMIEALYLADAHGFDGARESADRGVAWALGHRVDRHDWTAVTNSRAISSGTNALLVAGLVERRLATGDETFDELIDRLGRFLVGQTEPTGALLAYYDLDDDRPRPGSYSKYYTGESYWALTRLHRFDPGGGWGEVADRIGGYLATERDDVEDLWPPIADHWAAYGLAETAAFGERPRGTPLTDDELDYLRSQAGLFGQRVRSISQRFGPWGVLVRGTFQPRGGGYGVFGEGLTGLWRASLLDDRLAEVRSPIAARATCIAGLAIRAQADAAEASRFAAPGKVAGAWFRDDVTRMDDQQHALSALLFTLPMLEAGGAGAGGDDHPAPVTWVWVVVVIAVVNPVRAAFGVPSRGRSGSRPDRARLAAAGALIGAAVLLAVGATSGAVLDALAVSRPAMRIAAAALCALSGVVDLVRRPPSPEPALRGWGAAAVPLALPLVVRPAMTVAGLGVVADHGVGVYALALAATVAAVAIAAAALPTAAAAGPGRRVGRWAANLLGAVAVAGGVVLAVDGVFDV